MGVTKYEELMLLLSNPDTFGYTCYEFKCSANRFYPKIKINQKTIYANRIVLEFTLGRSLDSGEFALHRCDNPRCINPHHLFPGTALDNMKDKIQKGRMVSSLGAKNGASKLSESSVREIRAIAGKTHDEIAAMYNTSRSNVTNIKNGKAWKHVS